MQSGQVRGKATFCGNLQRWGHKVWQCNNRVKCGFCSGRHDTKFCKDRISQGEEIMPRSPNCYHEHNTWSPRCPKRPDVGRLNNDSGSRQRVAVPPLPSPPGITALSFLALAAPSRECSTLETPTHRKAQPNSAVKSHSVPPSAAPETASPLLLLHPSPRGATSSAHRAQTTPHTAPATELEEKKRR